MLIENGKIRTNKIIRTINDADGFTFRNLEIQATDNRITVDDSRNVTFENVTLHIPDGALDIEMKGKKTENITIITDGEKTVCHQGKNSVR